MFFSIYRDRTKGKPPPPPKKKYIYIYIRDTLVRGNNNFFHGLVFRPSKGRRESLKFFRCGKDDKWGSFYFYMLPNGNLSARTQEVCNSSGVFALSSRRT